MLIHPFQVRWKRKGPRGCGRRVCFPSLPVRQPFLRHCSYLVMVQGDLDLCYVTAIYTMTSDWVPGAEL